MKAPPILLLLLSAVPVGSVLAAEPLRLETTRDLWISAYKTEREGNNGGSPKLKLKGVQELFLIDFDPAPLKGKRVVRAELHLHGEGAEALGRVTVSSVAEEWVEGTGTGYAKVNGASSFLWAKTDEVRWGAGKGADVTEVINGVGGSVWGFGDATPRDENGWQVVPIDPAVVQARVDGRSHGFSVMDDVGSEYTREGNQFTYRPFLNRYVTSSEGGAKKAPFFQVWVEEGGTVPASVHLPTAKSATVAGKLPEKAAASKLVEVPAGAVDDLGMPLKSLDFAAARGEAIGFSVPAPLAEVTLDLPGVKVRRYRQPKVAGQVDPLVPEGWSASPGDASEDGGTYVEVMVPKGTQAGRIEGKLSVSGKTYPCALRVWGFTLPDRLSFLPQMNCYGLPGHERDFYRLAQENRTVLNRLPYGWTGRVDARTAPKVGADGKWDWTAWDAAFGPLLDGSAFADLPRGAVPVEAFYLPLNENWPVDHDRHFLGGYWVESAYDDAYWPAFRAAAGEFARHFAERGWREPMFEFYLNNKVYFKHERGDRWDACSAPWVFDEPSNTQDFWALRRFGLEFWRGVSGVKDVNFAFRADISRPEWQRDLLDGVTSAEVVSGILRTYRDRVMERAGRLQNLVYMYGSANVIGTPNSMPAAWCVETWALGADGVVPWQTIGKPAAWEKPDQLSLFYPTETGPVPSLRLKAFRAGEQLVEYLTMYAELSGQTRDAVGAAVLGEPGLRATVKKKSEADAGDSLFGTEAGLTLRGLRERLGAWLDAKAPAPRERWHDPRPPVRDPGAVREIVPVPLKSE